MQSEIELAFSGGLPIVPFHIDSEEPSGNLRYLLAGTHWFNAEPAPLDMLPQLVEQTRLVLERFAQPIQSDEAPAHAANAIPQERSNLPFGLTELIGREHELAQVRRLLASSRVVTLAGAGGIGKTRLALETGRQSVSAYPDGAWIVELAALTDPASVATAVVDALKFSAVAGERPDETLARELRFKSLLLVVDNCEHLLDRVATLCNKLIAVCPSLRILATSREPLGIAAEQVFRVPSLSTTDAVALFVQRATLANSDFVLTAADAPIAADICTRLDGIALAIELAAARTKTLSIPHLLARLDERFCLLTGGNREALPRHKTLSALIDWSYNLLSGEEKALFESLGVFSSAFTLEAAVAIRGEDADEAETLDLLSALVDKSLVVTESTGEADRFRLLESIREYALSLLREGDRLDALQERRIAYAIAYTQSAASEMSTAPQRWLARLESDIDELRAVMELTIRTKRNIEAGGTSPSSSPAVKASLSLREPSLSSAPG